MRCPHQLQESMKKFTFYIQNVFSFFFVTTASKANEAWRSQDARNLAMLRFPQENSSWVLFLWGQRCAALAKFGKFGTIPNFSSSKFFCRPFRRDVLLLHTVSFFDTFMRMDLQCLLQMVGAAKLQPGFPGLPLERRCNCYVPSMHGLAVPTAGRHHSFVANI